MFLIKFADRSTILGEGKFGQVVKGRISSGSNEIDIAVKMPKTNGTAGHLKSLLNELKLLAYLEFHPNIVRLFAANTKNIAKSNLTLNLYAVICFTCMYRCQKIKNAKSDIGKVLIGLEFCEHNSIRKYLRNNRGQFDMKMAEIINKPR